MRGSATSCSAATYKAISSFAWLKHGPLNSFVEYKTEVIMKKKIDMYNKITHNLLSEDEAESCLIFVLGAKN